MGVLVPWEGDESQQSGETSTAELDGAGDAKGADDAGPPEPTAARRAFFPSSMGVTAWQFPKWFITQDVEPAEGRPSVRSRRLAEQLTNHFDALLETGFLEKVVRAPSTA